MYRIQCIFIKASSGAGDGFDIIRYIVYDLYYFHVSILDKLNHIKQYTMKIRRYFYRGHMACMDHGVAMIHDNYPGLSCWHCVTLHNVNYASYSGYIDQQLL